MDERRLVSDVQFKIANWIAQYYQAPLGYCLKTVLPQFLLKKSYPISANADFDIKAGQTLPAPLFVATKAKSSIENIKNLIRQTLKEKNQVLILVPETSIIGFYYEELAKHYEAASIHSGMAQKVLSEKWGRIVSGETDIIIGTRQALFIPFHKLGLIVVDDPSNDAYKSDMTPKYNAVDLSRKISRINNCKIVYLSSLPLVADYWGIKNKNLEFFDASNQKRPSVVSVDMVKEIRSGNFSQFSRDLQKAIESAAINRKKVLIFSPRKGYSGILICENCGFFPKCRDCSVALRLHKVPEPIMTCHRCLKSDKVINACPNCHSSKLKPVGTAGTQKIKEEVERYLESKKYAAPVILVDNDFVETENQEKEVIDQINQSEFAVIVATHKILPLRYSQKFDMVALLNADSMLNWPDFQSDEKFLYHFEKLLDFDPEEVIIQSYNTDNTALMSAVAGDRKPFFENDLAARELFYYPPFSRIAKLTFKHKDEEKASYAARVLSEKLKMAIIKMQFQDLVKIAGPYPALVGREKGFYIYNLVLKIPVKMRPEEILKFVPPYWSVDLDPRQVV